VSKTLRLSEQWFRRGLWLVALVFAGFLMKFCHACGAGAASATLLAPDPA
jgi:hypothetical protein